MHTKPTNIHVTKFNILTETGLSIAAGAAYTKSGYVFGVDGYLLTGITGVYTNNRKVIAYSWTVNTGTGDHWISKASPNQPRYTINIGIVNTGTSTATGVTYEVEGMFLTIS